MMKPDHIEQQKRLDRFKTGLKNAGVKCTHQRIEIFKELANSCEHPDVATVFNGVRQRLPTISLDTVYRTLSLFVDLGLVSSLSTHGDRMRFDANDRPHHHFVCGVCGLTRDFYCEQVDRIALPKEVEAMGTVEMRQMEVRGICSSCNASIKQTQSAKREEGDR
ncbi:MAG: transcriptional repressor [bacterium]